MAAEKPKHTYANLAKHFAEGIGKKPPLDNGGYTASIRDADFIYITKNAQSSVQVSASAAAASSAVAVSEADRKRADSELEIDWDNLPSRQASSGWKFHISVDKNKYSEALDIINPILRKYQVNEFKINHPDSKNTDESRWMTIYSFKEPERSFAKNAASWEAILTEITRELAAAGISPGPLATGNSGGGTDEEVIRGTNYISCRNDARNHRDEEMEGNPIKDIVVRGVDHQTPRPDPIAKPAATNSSKKPDPPEKPQGCCSVM